MLFSETSPDPLQKECKFTNQGWHTLYVSVMLLYILQENIGHGDYKIFFILGLFCRNDFPSSRDLSDNIAVHDPICKQTEKETGYCVPQYKLAKRKVDKVLSWFVLEVIFNPRRSAKYNRLVETGFCQQISAVLAKPFSGTKMISKDCLLYTSDAADE